MELPKSMNCEPAEKPLRIAIAYSRIPFPMMRGDQLTVSHLISFLAARGHAVDLYTLDVQGEMTPAQTDWLSASCRTVRIYAHPLWLRAVAALTGLARLLPVQVGMFQNGRLGRDLRAACASGDYDVVYSYYIRSAPAVPWRSFVGRSDGVPVQAPALVGFLAMQLSQTLNSRRIYENEHSLPKKLFYWLETKLCARYEARIWRRFTRAVLIGPADVEAVKSVGRSQGQPEISNWIYGAHGTDTDKFEPARPEDVVADRVVFSGSMLYQPNIQAVLWFQEHCWPAIRRAVPTATLVIQGRDPTPEIQALDGANGVTVTGTVPDVGVMIRSATVCINPMLAAGGMQNKLIEYMACAKAVVATTIANEGIMAPADTLRVADDAGGFAQAVIDLLKTPHETLALGRAARAYVVENWTWEAHFLKLEAAFQDAVASV